VSRSSRPRRAKKAATTCATVASATPGICRWATATSRKGTQSPADDKVKDRVADVERLMKEGMAQVVPGMTDLDPRYDPETRELI
jgi:hypothetical protein